MKESRYMASKELNELMWLSAAIQSIALILENEATTNKSWRRWLSTGKSYLQKVVDDRMTKLDPVEEGASPREGY